MSAETSPLDFPRLLHDVAPDIDHQLGDSSNRFFGEGFARVRHELTWMSGDQDRSDFAINALYPDDWSRKNGQNQSPHLASVDAMVLTARMIEEHLRHRPEAGDAGSHWISHCSLRPGREAVDVSETLRASLSVEPQWPAETKSFCSRLQSFSVEMSLRASEAVPCAPDSTPELTSYYTDGYKGVERRLSKAERNSVKSIWTAGFQIDDILGAAGYSGLESGHGSVVSFVDANIIAAQLGQVIIYELDDVARESSRTLWLRKAEFRRSCPPSERRTAGDAEVELVKTLLIERSSTRWRTATLHAVIGDVDVIYSLAHDVSVERKP